MVTSARLWKIVSICGIAFFAGMSFAFFVAGAIEMLSPPHACSQP